MVFKKEGTTDFGAKYTVIEGLTIYNVENSNQHEKLVEKLNSQVGHEHFKVTDVQYPTEIVIDAHELMELQK